jgi:hypothetical protein
MASHPPPRVAAALAAVVVVLGGAGAAALLHGSAPDRTPVAVRTPTRPTTEPPATAAPAGAVAGTNRALAAAEAGRISLSLSLPPGARAVPAFPSRLLGRLVDAGVASDPTLRRVGRWVVPLSKLSMERWYARHLPSSVSHDYDPSAPPATRGYFGWRVTENSPAFTDPEVLLAFVGWGRHRTALRTDVSLAAYSDRTAETLVPATVTRIDIRARAIDGPPPFPHKRGSTSDPAVVGRIASSFDAITGAPEGAGPSPCGSLVGSPGQRAYVYTVTFHWPGHELVVDPGQPTCGVGMGLTLNGRRLPQVLAGTEEFDRSLEAALRPT